MKYGSFKYGQAKYGTGYGSLWTNQALHADKMPREISFRYDLLDRHDRRIKSLDSVTSASLSCQAFADIKRSMRLTMRDDPFINFLTDRIQPFIRFRMPDGGYAEWPQGIFLLSSPDRREERGRIYRDIEAYDGLQILLDDKFEDRHTVTSGTNYVTAIRAIIASAGIDKINIQGIATTLSADQEYEPGTPKLRAVNDLLGQINYTALYVDQQGFYTSNAYVLPSQRAPDHTYKDDALSVLYNGLVDSLDLFGVPNHFVVYTSNPDMESLKASYTNDNPDSPLSTVNRGRTITDFRQVEAIADQATLDAYVKRIAFEASQVYGHIMVDSAIMPGHGVFDVVQLQYSSMGIDDKYTEMEWSMPLEAGGRMRHKLRRVVTI